MKNSILFFLAGTILCLLNSSCTKDFRFDGITETDVVGQLISEEDPGDWRLDDDWGNAVQKLFDVHFEGECTLEDISRKEDTDVIDLYRIAEVGPAFPNPATSSAEINFYTASGGIVQVLLVDRAHKVIMKQCIDLSSSYNYTLHTDLSDIDERGELYRFFYKHVSEQGTFFGHGDVMVE